jgi:hypothetical protein
VIEIVAIGIFWTWTVWTWVFIAWLFTGKQRNGVLWDILQETKHFFLVLTVAKFFVHDPVEAYPDAMWLLPLLWACDLLWVYWVRRDLGGDDRWKKRRKKAAARVREVAGRLVIVPEAVPVSTH